MKFNDIIKLSIAFAAGVSALAGCKKEQDPVAAAVQTKEVSLTFEARNAEPQVINVYADGTWVADVSEDWLEVSPESGCKNTEVTVTILEDNVDAAGKLNAPREAVLSFKGSSSERMGKVYVTQKGDNYFGIEECTLSEAVAMDVDTKVKLSETTVLAVAKTGFVFTDGKTVSYADGSHDIKPGDKVLVNGTVAKYGDYMGIAADELSVNSSSEVQYPDPVEVTGKISSVGGVKYVKLSATLVSGVLRLSDGSNCSLLDPSVEMDLDALNVHKLEILGYYVGKVNKAESVIVCSYKDNGADSSVGLELPFKDDFSWLTPYIEAANSKLPEANQISDCVGSVTSSADGAANLYTTLANNGCDVIGELRRHGYTDLNPDFKTIYLQNAYLKYGAGKKQSGLTLPLFKMEGTQDLRVSFRWCSQMQGDGNIDDTKILITISGPGAIEDASDKEGKISKSIAHKQKQNEMFWQDAVFTVKGASNATAITIRPEQFGTPDNVQNGYYRYYLDDISVMLAADAVESNISVTGLEDNLITFEGTPEGPVSFDVFSDVDFTVSPSVSWLHIQNGEGLAGETKTVTVTCDQSELSTLRKGEIIVRSGITSQSITVIQSAAGQTLEPFISIVGGNSTTVAATAGTYPIKIQTNVPFEFTADVNWISPAQQTKALVTVTDAAFAVAANTTSDERVAHIRLFNKDYNIETVYTVTQLSDHAKLPVKWTIRSSCNFKTTWTYPYTENTPTVEGKTGYMDATTGLGTIWFSNSNGVAVDVNKKCSLDVSDDSPRVMGVWKGDFCQFKVPGKVDAGKKVRISFETRVSKTHPKYWRLQYLDGSDWKDACATQTAAVEGEGDVVYTHQMAGDGSTNIQVDATVTYGANTDNVVFRFICQTAMQASGAGCLAAPNGGSWRLSVTNKADDDQWQPTIQFVD